MSFNGLRFHLFIVFHWFVRVHISIWVYRMYQDTAYYIYLYSTYCIMTYFYCIYIYSISWCISIYIVLDFFFFSLFISFVFNIGCCFVTFFTRKAALNAQDALHNVKTLVGVSVLVLFIYISIIPLLSLYLYDYLFHFYFVARYPSHSIWARTCVLLSIVVSSFFLSLNIIHHTFSLFPIVSHANVCVWREEWVDSKINRRMRTM